MTDNKSAQTTLRPMPPGVLFDGDDVLFKRVARNAKSYVEYGCGSSTIWMAENTDAKICAVDTSADWAERTNQNLKQKLDCAVTHIDLGPIGAWGRPAGYTQCDKFQNYFFNVWDNAPDADMVLIDGRFRVASFCASVIRAKPGTLILFDDYTNRPYYHLVETILPPTEFCGRQALFKITDKADKQTASNLLEKFEYVMD